MIQYEKRNPTRIPSAEAAVYLGVTNACLCKWRQRGEGPAYFQFGTRYYYAVTDLEDWVAAAAVDPGA